MYNLFKILALGIIVTKARISFSACDAGAFVSTCWRPGGVVSEGPGPPHSAHIRSELLHIWNYTRRSTSVKTNKFFNIGGRWKSKTLLKPDETTGHA